MYAKPHPHSLNLVGVAGRLKMTSVATQTQWSWLQDLEEISRLAKEPGADFSLRVNEIQKLLEGHGDLNPDGRSAKQ